MRVNVFLIATAKMVLSALEIIATPLSWILLLNFQVNNFYRLGRAVVTSENPEVPVLSGWLSLPSLVEIGLTDLPKFGGLWPIFMSAKGLDGWGQKNGIFC